MYSIEDKVIMWLSSFEFVSYKKVKAVLDTFDNLEELFNNLKDYKLELLKIFKHNEYEELLSANNFLYVTNTINNYEKQDIKVLTIKSEEYPEYLREIDTPPIMLYCKGNISLLKTECLAVVGTRRATNYGKTACKKLISEVAVEGITIVSGLAEGIDTIAHKSTLEVNGKTIAVLGSGLLHIYPSSNESLFQEILDKDGLIISEYKPNEPSVTYHFPVRNRIIAGISKATFIVEATEKSGSMHTKNYALEYNREVFALPARINDIYSVGCNKIISNGQARMVLSSADIIDFYGKSKRNNSSLKAIQMSYEEQLIYDALDLNEMNIDDIIKKTKMETKVILTMLMRMEIKGIIKKLPGNLYAIDR
ncbi:MAG: DNA-protecting protein DprA [Clostridiales bacterium]|nr:DNA-protecting protein DprA [Clostridiales bacterium]